MQLRGLYNIRRKKRISRKKLAEDLHLTEEYIKALETTDEETVGNKLIQMFADYFDCSPFDILNDDEGDELIKNKITIEKIEVPKGVRPYDANMLLFNLLKKYSPINSNNINQLISEFKYRLGDLAEESTVNRLLRSEFNINNNYEPSYEEYEDINDEDDENEEYLKERYGQPLNFSDKLIESIRKDAKTASILYKELRANGLSEHESYMLLRIILDT